MKGNKSGWLVTGLLVGALAGVAVGLLAAPRTGKESRETLRHKAGDYAGTLRERFQRGGAPEHANNVVAALTS